MHCRGWYSLILWRISGQHASHGMYSMPPPKKGNAAGRDFHGNFTAPCIPRLSSGGLGIENGGVNTQDGSHDHQEQRHHLAGPHPPHPGSTLVHGNKTLMTPFESQKRSFLPLPSHIHDQTACLVSDLVTTTIMAPSTTRTIETTGPTRQAKCTAPSSMQGFSRRSARTAWQISRPGKCTDIPGIDTSGSGREKAA